LQWYRSRWYDSSLGRFAQADTLIPNPGNAQSWDHFAYAANPLRFIDPTGHDICTPDDPYCDTGLSNGMTEIEQYRYEIEQRYTWEVDENFTLEQVILIWETGSDISNYVESVDSTIDGDAWIRKNLGNIVLHRSGFVSYELYRYTGSETSLVFVNYHVQFAWNFHTGANPKEHIAHELAHVLDNKLKSFSVWTGGGPSDELVKFVGGNPQGLRWANTKNVNSTIPNNMLWQKGKGYYGNNSTADYFAEAFAWSIYDQSIVPGSNSEVKTWIDSLISLTAP
jgi:hypothetical protein